MDVLSRYIPKEEPVMLPATTQSQQEPENPAERAAIIRMLFQLKQDVDYLKEVVAKAGFGGSVASLPVPALPVEPVTDWNAGVMPENEEPRVEEDPEDQEYQEHEEEVVSMKMYNLDLIEKVLKKHNGNRKAAAKELGISERTLYRKLKDIKGQEDDE